MTVSVAIGTATYQTWPGNASARIIFMRPLTQFLTTLILLALGSWSVAAQVDSVVQTARGGNVAPDGADHVILQDGGLTLDQAVQQVRRQYKGRIVSAETRVSGGRETHIIKVLLSDGTVKTVRVPGRSV